MDRNRLIFGIIYFGGSRSDEEIYELDWDSPYDSPDFENPIYPMTFTSAYFPDLQSIYDLVNDTYVQSAAEDILYSEVHGGQPLYTEINGQAYQNISAAPIWSSDPFVARSYIEITEKTENKCSFIWRYADIEHLNQPESGYEFYYFKKFYTASYVDGSWKLDHIVFNNHDSHEYDAASDDADSGE